MKYEGTIMTYIDKTVPCRDCGGFFEFSAGEQEFYASKGFTNEPVRCPLRRRAIKGLQTDAGREGSVCPQDVSAAGRIGAAVIPQPARNTYRSGDGAASTTRPAHRGALPAGVVQATIIRIDPSWQYLFVRIDDTTIDAYVHASLFAQQRTEIAVSDVVFVELAASAKGPRAVSFSK
jgi:cold shock CspA family protein